MTGWAAVGSEDHRYIQPVDWQRDMTKTVLQMPDPEWAGYPQAISDTGFVAGYLDDGGSHPPGCHLWTPWGRGIDIDVGNYCVAHGVDDLARVVGEHQFDGGVHGFLWKAGRMHDLGTLGGSPSIAYAINLRGQVVGAPFTAGNERHAFLWHGGKMTDIGNWEDFYDSIAWAINARGEIVDWASRRGQDNRAVRFDHGRVVPLEDEVESLGECIC